MAVTNTWYNSGCSLKQFGIVRRDLECVQPVEWGSGSGDRVEFPKRSSIQISPDWHCNGMSMAYSVGRTVAYTVMRNKIITVHV